MDLLWWFVGVAMAVVSAGSAGKYLDDVMLERHRDAIGAFIFGDRRINFPRFEKSVIEGLLGIFMHKGDSQRFSAYRIYIWSGGVALLSSIVLFSVAILRESPISHNSWSFLFIAIFLYAFITSYLSFPGDYFSFFITKTIFLNRDYKTYHLPIMIILDIIVTIIPFFVVMVAKYVSFALSINNFSYFDMNNANQVIFYVILLTATTTIILTILQIIILLGGLSLRSIAIAAKFLGFIGTYSNAKKQPISVLLALTALVTSLSVASVTQRTNEGKSVSRVPAASEPSTDNPGGR